MIAFIVKSAVCMVLFFGLYWLLLRKEKLFIFNRYYLICSLVFSLAVPFLSLPVSMGYKYVPIMTTVSPDILPDPVPLAEAAPSDAGATVMQESHTSDNLSRSEAMKPSSNSNLKIVLFIYMSGLVLMLARFIRNIMMVIRMLRSSEKIECEWYHIALINDRISPFSFLRTVFLNREDYIEKRVGDNVMNHELEHIRQSHSFDILFFEILHMTFWFNPILFFYKRAARINHEYLADEAVISGSKDLNSYMNELITFVSRSLRVPYTSGFSPSMIKLRLLMLNTKTSRQVKINRLMGTLLMSVILMGGLSMKPVYKEPDDRRKRAAENKDIVIKDVFFRNKDFSPMKALVVLDGEMLKPEDSVSVDISDIKTLNVLDERKARRKYGRIAKDGALEISTYENDKGSVPDSMYFKPIYTVNDMIPGKRISIQVSNLYSVTLWTYPVFRNQEPDKRWRLLDIMTRDYYKIEGSVTQSNGKPLNGVLVSVREKTQQEVTGDDGRFSLSDISLGTWVELSAAGYVPYRFRVPKSLFNTDLSITLRGISEPDSDLILTRTGNKIIDFSGKWSLNSQKSGISYPDANRKYEIRQFNSDSIIIVNSSTLKGKEYTRKDTYVFNTVTADTSYDQTSRHLISCTISPDGRSFSISESSKSFVSKLPHFGFGFNYSLSEDGKQLIVRQYSLEGTIPRNGRPFPTVFDRE